MLFGRKKPDPISGMTQKWEAVEKIADPAEKILALNELKTEVVAAVSEAGGNIARFERSNMSMMKFGIWAPIAGGALLSAIFVNPIPLAYGIGCALPGGAIGAAVDKGTQASGRAISNKKNRPKLEALQELHAKVASSELQILKADVEKLESSPRSLEVLQAYPVLQAAFAHVAMRRTLEDKAKESEKKAERDLPIGRPLPKPDDGNKFRL